VWDLFFLIVGGAHCQVWSLLKGCAPPSECACLPLTPFCWARFPLQNAELAMWTLPAWKSVGVSFDVVAKARVAGFFLGCTDRSVPQLLPSEGCEIPRRAILAVSGPFRAHTCTHSAHATGLAFGCLWFWLLNLLSECQLIGLGGWLAS